MKLGLLPAHCRTHWIREYWIRGFMTFRLAWRTRAVMRKVPT
jgi:hypothetical protein